MSLSFLLDLAVWSTLLAALVWTIKMTIKVARFTSPILATCFLLVLDAAKTIVGRVKGGGLSHLFDRNSPFIDVAREPIYGRGYLAHQTRQKKGKHERR